MASGALTLMAMGQSPSTYNGRDKEMVDCREVSYQPNMSLNHPTPQICPRQRTAKIKAIDRVALLGGGLTIAQATT